MQKILFYVGLVVLVTGCSIFPDSFTISSRVDKRGNYDSTQFGVTYNNPYKPRKVVQENYVSLEGGSAELETP